MLQELLSQTLRSAESFATSGGDVNKLSELVDSIERLSAIDSASAAAIAQSALDSLHRGMNRKVGFDVASVLDSDPELWVEMRQIDDNWFQSVMASRERLRTIALGQ